MYWLYILRCADCTYYTGITTDVERRLREHNTGKRGAKYTRYRRPVSVIYTSGYRTKSEAIREENHIKALARAEKEKLISNRG